jgi:hypothetical protein
MPTFVRAVAAFVVAVSVFFFVFWVPCSVLYVHEVPGLAFIVSAACAFFAARSVSRRIGAAPGGLLTAITTGGLVVGSIGFVVGFFGPMIWAPDANQGPLLGLFITGPLGFLAGCAGGAIWWFAKRRRAEG